MGAAARKRDIARIEERVRQEQRAERAGRVAEIIDLDYVRELRRKSRALSARVIAEAQRDFRVYCELVGRDEETHTRIVLDRSQLEWIDAVEQNDEVIFWSHPESGKSSIWCVLYPTWRLGRNPEERIALVSRTRENATKNLSAIKLYIEQSADLHAVFPDLVPGPKWTDTKIIVRRRRFARDPSVDTYGLNGAVTGARKSLMLADDITDYENTRNATQRQVSYERFKRRFLTRRTPTAKTIVTVNAWHPDDIPNRLAKEGWAAKRYPVCDPDGKSRSARWPDARIVRERKILGESEFERIMRTNDRDDTSQRFTEDLIRQALVRGYGMPMLSERSELPPEWSTFGGMDLAASESATNMRTADTACVMLGVSPTGGRLVVDVAGGKWGAPRIVRHAFDVEQRFEAFLMVENNGVQKYILQFAEEKDASAMIVAFRTGNNKADPQIGVESLIIEMERGLWAIPSMGNPNDPTPHPAAQILVDQMRDYRPGEHVGDYLMALWISKECARRFRAESWRARRSQSGIVALGEREPVAAE